MPISKIRKIAAMVCFSLLQSTHEESIIYYKAVKITINTPKLAEVILDVKFISMAFQA